MLPTLNIFNEVLAEVRKLNLDIPWFMLPAAPLFLTILILIITW